MQHLQAIKYLCAAAKINENIADIIFDHHVAVPQVDNAQMQLNHFQHANVTLLMKGIAFVR